MICSLCRGEAFYARSHEGTNLCERCFKDSIEEKVRRTIAKYGMLNPHDHIAVAVSGGKDSLTLLRILKRIERRFPRVQMTAIIVDEGIQGYRDEALEIASAFCEEVEVQRKVVSFGELYSMTMDGVVKKKGPLTPCAYCGVLRRRAIEKGARAVGATKIATGHNLDDEAQTVLLNIFHGDVERLARAGPKLEDTNRRFLPRIKPLCEIPEREIVLYAYLAGVRFQTRACPHGSEAMREDVRELLNEMEEKRPGIKYTVYRSGERIREALKATLPKFHLRECSICGEPCANETCAACTILRGITPPALRSGEATPV